MKKANLYLVALMMLGVAFTACSDDDNDKGGHDDVYIEKTVEAHEYNEWSYFNFETGEVKKLTINKKESAGDDLEYGVDAAEEAALDWDIAIHKYDIRTKDGLVKKLEVTDLDAVNIGSLPADSEMVADTDGSVMADMSNMQSGQVGYQKVKLNKELSGWVTATPTGTMPPYKYTLNDNVFVVKVGGKVWKMKFIAYTYGGKTATKFCYGEVK